MAYLLDTHALLWYFSGSDALSRRAKSEISDPRNKAYISIVSLWEIGIKINLGKLKLDIRFEDFKEEILKNQIEILPLEFSHLLGLIDLENIHRDPFDRILICQARLEKLTIISKDPNFSSYKSIRVIW